MTSRFLDRETEDACSLMEGLYFRSTLIKNTHTIYMSTWLYAFISSSPASQYRIIFPTEVSNVHLASLYALYSLNTKCTSACTASTSTFFCILAACTCKLIGARDLLCWFFCSHSRILVARLLNAESQMLNVECRMQNEECWKQNAEHGMQCFWRVSFTHVCLPLAYIIFVGKACSWIYLIHCKLCLSLYATKTEHSTFGVL